MRQVALNCFSVPCTNRRTSTCDISSLRWSIITCVYKPHQNKNKGTRLLLPASSFFFRSIFSLDSATSSSVSPLERPLTSDWRRDFDLLFHLVYFQYRVQLLESHVTSQLKKEFCSARHRCDRHATPPLDGFRMPMPVARSG